MKGILTPSDRAHVAQVLEGLEANSQVRFVHAYAGYTPDSKIMLRVGFVKSPERYLVVEPKGRGQIEVSDQITLHALELRETYNSHLIGDKPGPNYYVAQFAPYIDGASGEEFVRNDWFTNQMAAASSIGPETRQALLDISLCHADEFLRCYQYATHSGVLDHQPVLDDADSDEEDADPNSVIQPVQPVVVAREAPQPVPGSTGPTPTPALRSTLANFIAAVSAVAYLNQGKALPPAKELSLPEGSEILGMRKPGDAITAKVLPTTYELASFLHQVRTTLVKKPDTAVIARNAFGMAFSTPKTINEVELNTKQINDGLVHLIQVAQPTVAGRAEQLKDNAVINGIVTPISTLMAPAAEPAPAMSTQQGPEFSL